MSTVNPGRRQSRPRECNVQPEIKYFSVLGFVDYKTLSKETHEEFEMQKQLQELSSS